MDVWVSYSKRRQSCTQCTKPIVAGDETVFMQTKRTISGWGTRTWRTANHFECWIMRTRIYLAEHPYEPKVPVSPGRPRKYTPAQAKRRIYLQITMSRWRKQQAVYTGDGMWAMAGRYRDKIAVIREELDGMVVGSD